jgi:hypothetical protein
MNVTMCDKFLCKWGFGFTYDTTCQTFGKYLIKNLKKITMQKIQNKMKTHLVIENGSKKCNSRTHNEKNIKKVLKH